MNPKVSVVMKSYNHEKYIADAINSILNQSFQDFELIITDDASTDKTVEIIRNFKDGRIHCEFSKFNEGISIAMNRTLNRATGEYIAILNSDDIALPGRLERQVTFLDCNPQISSLFSMPIEIDDLGISKPTGANFEKAMRLVNSSRATWLRHFFFHGNCLCAPTAMIRRSAIIDCGGYDPRLGSLNDFDYWLRMLLRGHSFAILPEALTAFRIRSNLQNASSPTFFNLTRANYEHSKVLNHFRKLSREFILEIFQDDIRKNEISLNLNSDQILIELALKTNSIPIYLFGLDTLFDVANSPDEFRALKNASGSLDIFRIAISSKQRDELIEVKAKLAKFE